MVAYLVRRLLLGAVVLAAVSFAAFAVVASRINPLWTQLLSPSYQQVRARIAPRAHLDDSVVHRYWLWVKGVFGFGSYGHHTILAEAPIWPSVWTALGHTVQLGLATLIVVVPASLAIGVVTARRPGSMLDLGLRGAGYLTWSIPVFLAGLMVQQLLLWLRDAHGVEPLPIAGPPPPFEASFGFAWDWLRHMLLPVLTLAACFVGPYSRYIRSSLLVALRAPYTQVARAKGLSEHRVAARHALRNSLIPFVSVLTLDFGNLFAGSLATDVVFRLQGMGGLFVYALSLADPLLIVALLSVTALLVIVFMLLADALIVSLDPRVRLT